MSTNGTVTLAEEMSRYIPGDPHFATKATHVGQEPHQWTHRAVIPPICMSTTFEQMGPNQPILFEYSRSGNPTRKCLEECLAALEGGKYGLVFSSGLGATTSVTHLLKSGDHIICGDDVYGGTNRYFRNCTLQMGIEVSFVDMTDIENINKAFRPSTRMTPTNPTLKVFDIKTVSEIVKANRPAVLVVDNTFMSSYFQKPLHFGADIVLHSISKYMNGHADVVMGAVITNDDTLCDRMKYYQNSLGTIPSPFDCFLVNRGLKTLHLRMERHMTNGLTVARHLEGHPMVAKVLHPGLPSHPQYELAAKQCSGSSGMVSFYIKGGIEEATAFVKNVKVFTLAESLGGVESLVEIPSLMTHASVPEADRAALGITDSLIRLSVGIESIVDLIQDLDHALEVASKAVKPTKK